jgi:hypothetical protein
MRSITSRPVLAALAGCFLMLWSGDKNVVEAQRRTPIVVTRIYTGADGQTHTTEIDVKLTPLAGKLEQWLALSETTKVSGSQFMRWSPGYVNDWHPARQRQYLITLSGRGELELVGGQKIRLEPGRILLAEDVTGKGHITRTLGTEDCILLLVHLADQ